MVIVAARPRSGPLRTARRHVRSAPGGWGRRVALFSIAAALALFGGVAPASAGLYHVYSCRTPAGAAAPTDGWASSVTGVGDAVRTRVLWGLAESDSAGPYGGTAAHRLGDLDYTAPP